MLDDLRTMSTLKFQKFYCRSFGDRLHWLRTFKGFTLEEFGNQLGCHKSYLSRLESGGVEAPSEKFINRLCGLIRVDREWLLSGTGDPFGKGSGVLTLGAGGAKMKPSQERLGRVMALLEDVFAVLEPEAVLAELLKNVGTDEIVATLQKIERSGSAGAFAKTAFWSFALRHVLLLREAGSEVKPDRGGAGPKPE